MVYIFYSHLRIYSINIYLLLFAFALAFHYLFYPSITSGMWVKKHLKEYLRNLITVISSSIIGLSIFTKVLGGGIAVLSTLVLWLTYQFFIPSANIIIDPRSLIVHQVKDVSELATAIFQAEKVIPVSKKDGLLESKGSCVKSTSNNSTV